MNFEANHREPFKLKMALLVYSGHRATGSGEETVITKHKVSDATILPGEPIDLATARAVFASKQDAKGTVNKDDLLRWQHPRTLATHPAWFIWWTPPDKREIFVAGKAHRSWFPGMVWCGSRTTQTVYLWAYDGAGEPSATTIVYRPEYGPHNGMNHIFPNSTLCVGSARIQDKTPAGWERAFFDSNFKTDGNLPANPYDPTTRFKKLGALRDVVNRATARSHSSD